MLPNESIIEFQDLYKRELGITITFEKALQKAEDFIQLFDLITRNEKKQHAMETTNTNKP